ncbi:outer membrane protein assembly factor BamB family protein [Stieleria varia]|uniref:Outer membrane biogenesis protein BamB n=1 Tax=Stieleria varia TaxID=2528005 RepID=A0A5C6B0W9_9BACT|nr:PQQ-binding-like beta-propeller repeat protein [Stieleria varia]TWU05560.1 outer membrane biogenesis protein BamB [Stieleria varia]
MKNPVTTVQALLRLFLPHLLPPQLKLARLKLARLMLVRLMFCSMVASATVSPMTLVAEDTDRTTAQQWPTFRGPHGNGIAGEAKLPAVIDESTVRWQTPIHGKGWSSPVVWGNEIWLTTATPDGKTMSVICVARDSGKILHDVVVKQNAEPAFCHPMNSYASPTPVVTAEHVFVHFGSYLTACLNKSDASMVWQRLDLSCDHHRGPASSPILYDGKLYIAYDGFDQQYVVALDAATGATVWRRDRDIDYGTDNGDLMKAYCTGHVIRVDGVEQLVYPSAVATIAYDPKTGEELWKVYHGGMNASARPIYSDGLIFLTNGMGSMVAVQSGGHGDVTETGIVWDSKKSVAKKSSPMVVDGLLYMISDDGVATCRDAKTGEIHWQERLNGEYAASPILADHRIYFFSREGDILSIAPGVEYKVLGEGKLGDGFMASPAVVGNEMILRSKSMLYCVSAKSAD